MRPQWYLKQTISSLDSLWTLIVSSHGCNYQYFNHILYHFYCRPWDRARVSSAGNCPEPSLCVKTGRRWIIQCLGRPVWPVSAAVMMQTRMTGFLIPSHDTPAPTKIFDEEPCHQVTRNGPQHEPPTRKQKNLIRFVRKRNGQGSGQN